MGGKTRLLGFLWLCFLLGTACAAAAGGLVYRSIQETNMRNTLSSQFGAEVLALCNSPKPKASDAKLSSSTNKFVVIDRNTSLIYTPFQNALSADQAATSKDDLTAVVCVRAMRDLVEDPCEYTSKTSSKNYTINRYGNDMELYLIDKATGKTFAKNTMVGADPEKCPEFTSENKTFEGAAPTAADFLKWLKARTANAR